MERVMSSLVVGDEASDSWLFLIEGLIKSGLHISELLDLHWTDPERIRPIREGRSWYLSVPSDRNKNGTDDPRPVTPHFREFLESVAELDQFGFVFNRRA